MKEAPKFDLNDGDLNKLVSQHKTNLKIVDGSKILPFVAVSGKVVPEDEAKLLANNTIINTGLPLVKGVIKEISILEHRKKLSSIGFW